MKPLSVLTGLLLPALAWAQGAARPEEILVKARALKVVAFFTVFPRQPTPARPWLIGIVGAPPFGKVLETLSPPEALMKGRRLLVTYPRTREEVEGLDVLFIGASADSQLADLLMWVKGRPILTVGEAPEFLERGTMIHLAMEDQRVRPWVNLRTAQGSGLSFSSFFLANSKVIAP